MAQSRNFGIDMLRIVSMLMVVMLHVLGQGGILDAVKPFSCNYYAANFLETLSYGAVDCFAIISGYVGVDSKFRYISIVTLWRKVAFYTLVITGGTLLLFPSGVTAAAIQKSLFPVSTSHYWYVTAYFLLFFFMPFLNKMVNALQKTELDRCMITLFVLFSVIPTMTTHAVFYINGYSFLWLAICYYIGAYLKKRELAKLAASRKALAWLMFWGCIVVTYGSVLLNDVIGAEAGIPMEDTLLNYTSPTILLAAMLLVLCFANLHLHEFAVRIVKILSPLAFQVYIIHCHCIPWNLLAERFAAAANLPPVLFVLLLMLFVLGIYAVCSAVDWGREAIDRKLHLKQNVDAALEHLLLQGAASLKQSLVKQ